MLLLSSYDGIQKVNERQGKIIAVLNKDISLAGLNGYLYGKKVILNHLFRCKPNLEEHFLELVKNHG